MLPLLSLIKTYLPKSEKGQDLAEYGLLVAVIAIIVIVGATTFGTQVNAFFGRLAAEVGSWTVP